MRPVTHAELHAELADIRDPLARLEARVTSAESVLVRLDERVKTIETHGATKMDLAALEIRLLDRMDKNFKWMIGTTIVLASVVIAGIGVLLTALPRLIGS